MKLLATKEKDGFEWIDLEDPGESEIAANAAKFSLLEQSIQDATEPDHLPKYERLDKYVFSIVRYYDPEHDKEADTVEELTNKISVVVGDDFVLTIHKKPWTAIERISKDSLGGGKCKKSFHVYVEIVKMALQSFEEPAQKLNKGIDRFEESILLKSNNKPELTGMYFLKRKIEVVKRVLLLSYDIVDNVDPEEERNAYTRDIRDLYNKIHNLFDSLAENANHLMNLYFNFSAQKTNETIRVLTIFSMFFLPLTFIVGIYGMNFKFMPELNWHFGYPAVYILMAVVTLTIFIWFRKKGWL